MEIDDEPGYSAAFSPLAFASKVDADPFAAIPSAPAFVATSLGHLSAKHPGQFGPLLASLEPRLQECLKKYVAAAGVPIQ